jgi:hypothetical protein
MGGSTCTTQSPSTLGFNSLSYLKRLGGGLVLAGDDGLLRDGTITKPKQNLKK